MATSSIFHNFVINDPKRFIDAYEESERWCAEHPRQRVNAVSFDDLSPEEQRAFVERFRENARKTT